MKMIPISPRLRLAAAVVLAAALYFSAVGLFLSRPASLRAQEEKIVWSDREKAYRGTYSTAFAHCRMT